MKLMNFFPYLALAALPACEPRNLYVAHDTVLGLNAKVSNGRQQGQLMLGYDRDFATIIPKSVDLDDDEGGKDVMALVHCSDLTVSGIYIDRYRDVTATGETAIKLAKEGKLPELLKNCDLEGKDQ